VELGRFKERVQRGRRARVQAGRLMHAWKPRYGFVWRDASMSAYDIDPLTAPIVKRMFYEATVLRLPANQIAKRLYADRIPTPLGKVGPWRAETITNIFRDPAYVGRAYGWRIGERKSRHGKAVNYVRPEDEWIPLPDGTVPQIVDEETWQAAQRLVEANAKRRAPSGQYPESHLLRGGLARCGQCGGTMVPDQRKTQNSLYRCNGAKRHPERCRGCYISAEILDREVWDWVRSRLVDPELIRTELERLREEDPTLDDMNANQRALALAQRRVANLTTALADVTNIEMQTVIKEQVNINLEQRHRLEVERDELLQRREAWQSSQLNLDAIDEWVRTVRDRLGPDESYANKRQTLDALEAQVTVYRADAPKRWKIETTIGSSSATRYGGGNKGNAAVIYLGWARPNNSARRASQS
jgi:site-specific DNA recombinase